MGQGKGGGGQEDMEEEGWSQVTAVTGPLKCSARKEGAERGRRGGGRRFRRAGPELSLRLKIPTAAQHRGGETGRPKTGRPLGSSEKGPGKAWATVMAGRRKRHCQGRVRSGEDGGRRLTSPEGVEQVHQSRQEKRGTVGALRRLGLGKVGKILGKSDRA